ncbi:hypothetical protein [Bosea sp. 117]|uniref:hypothetical protein n=1 Tax=Bosea sp. 117 TaxID=1125973 RepID=UPI000493E7BF|nr:hypothetical protein [Bosea sp. 117]
MAELPDPTIFQNRLIRAHVPGLSFVDIGGLWGTVNEKVTVAMDAGASAATMADILPFSHELWGRFDARAAELGFSGYGRRNVNLDSPDVHERLGTFDVVHCSGIIYHAPSPVHTLDRLASVTRRYLLLGSMVVPERVENEVGAIDFSGGQTLFIPAVNERKRAIMSEHFRLSGIEIMHFNRAESEPFRVDGKANYGPWWWLYAPSTMIGMLEASNFRVLDHSPEWGGRSHYFFCERV